MHVRFRTAVLAAALILLPASLPAAQKNDAPAIDPVASQYLARMCDYLKGLGSFSFRAEIDVDEVFNGGLTLQTSRTEVISVRRPDRLRAESVQDDAVKTIIYDGTAFTIYNKTQNLYSTVAVPSTLDAALDQILTSYGVTAPLAELILNAPHAAITSGILSGFYVGKRMVQGVACHHLAFTQKDVDWQIWIEDGDKPLPRKLVIVDKTLAGAPNYEAMLVDWKVNPRLKDSLFTFTPPKDAALIAIVPVADPTTVSQ
ncbi:DUF2092 domain-containing protein [Desulfolutivibrio sulfoxidireducens]|uniref:DUF2092 domain-containing protein n=1 Tax=Desulfolutivibrio sulfoxidireducens TaxID=2773299 RepID=UPI00159DD6A9|nr:DUF2092 domain-containing protein [Desulfolutivibrio sulfoxidireducens]QLA20148.1 DUF2092 domain-containing protein [Desulfolutivibrio sulfoxidireducens]